MIKSSKGFKQLFSALHSTGKSHLAKGSEGFYRNMEGLLGSRAGPLPANSWRGKLQTSMMNRGNTAYANRLTHNNNWEGYLSTLNPTQATLARGAGAVTRGAYALPRNLMNLPTDPSSMAMGLGANAFFQNYDPYYNAGRGYQIASGGAKEKVSQGFRQGMDTAVSNTLENYRTSDFAGRQRMLNSSDIMDGMTTSGQRQFRPSYRFLPNNTGTNNMYQDAAYKEFRNAAGLSKYAHTLTPSLLIKEARFRLDGGMAKRLQYSFNPKFQRYANISRNMHSNAPIRPHVGGPIAKTFQTGMTLGVPVAGAGLMGFAGNDDEGVNASNAGIESGYNSGLYAAQQQLGQLSTTQKAGALFFPEQAANQAWAAYQNRLNGNQAYPYNPDQGQGLPNKPTMMYYRSNGEAVY